MLLAAFYFFLAAVFNETKSPNSDSHLVMLIFCIVRPKMRPIKAAVAGLEINRHSVTFEARFIRNNKPLGHVNQILFHFILTCLVCFRYIYSKQNIRLVHSIKLFFYLFKKKLFADLNKSVFECSNRNQEILFYFLPSFLLFIHPFSPICKESSMRFLPPVC